MSNIVNPDSAGSLEYRKVLEQIIKDGKCPFCEENFRYHGQPILHNSGDWFITRNRYGYKDSLMSFIILNTKLHVEKYEDLKAVDHLAVSSLITWAITTLHLAGGAVAIRFGNPKYTGATVRHLHFHLIIPRIHEGKSVPVMFPIG